VLRQHAYLEKLDLSKILRANPDGSACGAALHTGRVDHVLIDINTCTQVALDGDFPMRLHSGGWRFSPGQQIQKVETVPECMVF
jgi:hypothetical protein